MDIPITGFVRAGSLEELKAKGRLVVHGPHRPILVIHDKDRVFALDNRCPHMGFPLDRGSVEDARRVAADCDGQAPRRQRAPNFYSGQWAFGLLLVQALITVAGNQSAQTRCGKAACRD